MPFTSKLSIPLRPASYRVQAQGKYACALAWEHLVASSLAQQTELPYEYFHESHILQVLLYNKQMYSAQQDQRQLPALLPALQYQFDIRIRCLDPEAGVDVIKILMHSSKSPVPMLSALVKMPLSEFEEE